MKSASDQHEQRVGCGGGWWGRVSAEITPVDSRIPGRGAASAQPQGREERPCQWSQEEAQRERKEAGWDTEASGPMSMCRPQGSSWMTQNNHATFSCKQYILCAKMMIRFIFGKRQQWGVPSEVSSLPDMRGEGAG